MRGEFTCQQAGIRTGDDNMFSTPQKPIDEQMPPFDILNLIEKEMINLSINFIDGLQDIVQITGLQLRQGFVIEIHIAEAYARILHRLPTHNRFSRTTHAEDGLCQRTRMPLT